MAYALYVVSRMASRPAAQLHGRCPLQYYQNARHCCYLMRAVPLGMRAASWLSALCFIISRMAVEPAAQPQNARPLPSALRTTSERMAAALCVIIKSHGRRCRAQPQLHGLCPLQRNVASRMAVSPLRNDTGQARCAIGFEMLLK